MQETKRRKEKMGGAHGVVLYNRLLTGQETRATLPDMNVFLCKYPSSRPIECRKEFTTAWIWFRSQTDMLNKLFPDVERVTDDPLAMCIIKSMSSSSGKCFGWEFRFASNEPPPLSVVKSDVAV